MDGTQNKFCLCVRVCDCLPYSTFHDKNMWKHSRLYVVVSQEPDAVFFNEGLRSVHGGE